MARPMGGASIRRAPQLRGRPVVLGEARARGREHPASFPSFVQESEKREQKAPLTLTSGGTSIELLSVASSAAPPSLAPQRAALSLPSLFLSLYCLGERKSLTHKEGFL